MFAYQPLKTNHNNLGTLSPQTIVRSQTRPSNAYVRPGRTSTDELFCLLQERPAFIPEAVVKKRSAMATQNDLNVAEDGSVISDSRRKTERDLELEMDDEYVLNLQSNDCFRFFKMRFSMAVFTCFAFLK